MRKETDGIVENGVEESDAAERAPLWETVVMVASFGLLWAWFLARQSTLKAGTTLSPLWSLILVATLLTLVVIMVRRLKRVKRALEENYPRRAGIRGYPPGMPMSFTQPHGTGQNPKRKNGKS